MYFWDCQQQQTVKQNQNLPYWTFPTENYQYLSHLPFSNSSPTVNIPWNSGYVADQNGFYVENTAGKNACNVPQPTISTPKENQNMCRNMKSLIIRDFIKSLKKDPSSLLILKQTTKIKCSIKSFIGYLQQKIPDEGKYIRLNFFLSLCKDTDNPEFSKVIRILLYNRLRAQYQNLILTKKNNKLSYLRACRELIQKLCHDLN